MADAVTVDLTLTDSDDDAPPSKVPRLREAGRISDMRGGGEAAHETDEAGDTPSPPPLAPAKSDGGDGGDEEELEFVAENGLDWRRDLPHARSLCREHPFEAQNFRGHANALSCDNCW